MPILIDRSRAVVSTAAVAPTAKNPPASAPPRTHSDAEEARVVALREELTDVCAIRRLADLFTALADPTRLRIIEALGQGELCVGDLSAVLSLTQSATSHQLRLLRGLRLVTSRREGRLIYYALDDANVQRLFQQGLEHIREHGTVKHGYPNS